MPLALGLDIGTTSIAALALDGDGRVVAQTAATNDAALAGLPPGRAEQAPLAIEQRALAALEALTSQLDETPVCLGLTGQMHGILLADAEGAPLTPLVTWQDRRANEPAASGRTYLEALLETLLDRCPAAALDGPGCRLSPGYGGVTLSCLHAHGELPSAAFTCATVVDWLGARLTGAPVSMDRTMAASLGVYDLRHDCWSEALIDALGLSMDWFPPVVESGSRLGGLSAAAAEATGLPQGLPVSVGLGDNQAAFLGGAPPEDDILAVNIGTGGQVSWPIDAFRRVDGMDTRYLPHGRCLLVGAGLSGGDAYAWVQRTAAHWLGSFGVERDKAAVYERLNQLAAAVPPGCDGLRCAPLFRGSRQRPLARGDFQGVTNDNFTLGHIARAVLEGVADGLAAFVDQAGPAAPRATKIIATGNAVRENPLLREILGRRFALPVQLPAHREEAAFGAALLAGAAFGVWPSLDEARSRTVVDDSST